MGNELQMGSSLRYGTQNENLHAKDRFLHKCNRDFSCLYNEEISIGSIVLRTKSILIKLLLYMMQVQTTWLMLPKWQRHR
ncbi:hypothetical protein [Methanosarcina sp.]|uniref:hypothetical protein n=1 Tax=Methanosarcina sp. TaxID=2213 RepID=UPI002989886A|nr:hypothetical protein [Methanosarcina sp.]MDW5549201.1 hypothetical protein [Methanosarcina sp.]MDW5553093.1 hypothetical protein [Methanosarcina sp.]MDW5559381.1 hypothetical protein [Methanosarcina sp.]